MLYTKKSQVRRREAFRAILVSKAVTGVAEMLGVTQPVVTHRVADHKQRIAIALSI